MTVSAACVHAAIHSKYSNDSPAPVAFTWARIRSLYPDEPNITEELKSLKKMMIEELDSTIEFYRNMSDKNQTLMVGLGVTIIIPLCYYFYKSYVSENLSSNRIEQCLELKNIIEFIAVNPPKIGKSNCIVDKIYDDLFDLFNILVKGHSQKLMPILIAIYGEAKKHHFLALPSIERYMEKHNISKHYDITHYFKERDDKIRMMIQESTNLPSALGNTIVGYSSSLAIK